jgi:hypothetical protein
VDYIKHDEAYSDIVMLVNGYEQDKRVDLLPLFTRLHNVGLSTVYFHVTNPLKDKGNYVHHLFYFYKLYISPTHCMTLKRSCNLIHEQNYLVDFPKKNWYFL